GQCLFDLFDFVGLPVERARDHQEGAARPQPVHLRDDGVGRGVAEHHLLNRAVNDTSLVHACPPRTIRLAFYEGNLAEPAPPVMCEDADAFSSRSPRSYGERAGVRGNLPVNPPSGRGILPSIARGVALKSSSLKP